MFTSTVKVTVNSPINIANGTSYLGVSINDQTRSLVKEFMEQKGAQVTVDAQKNLTVDRGWYSLVTRTEVSFAAEELQAFVNAKLPSQPVPVAGASNKAARASWSQALYSKVQDTTRAAGSLSDTLVVNRVAIATHTAAFALGVASLAVSTKVAAKLQAAKQQPTLSLTFE